MNREYDPKHKAAEQWQQRMADAREQGVAENHAPTIDRSTPGPRVVFNGPSIAYLFFLATGTYAAVVWFFFYVPKPDESPFLTFWRTLLWF